MTVPPPALGKIAHVSLGMNAHPDIGLGGSGWTPSVITDFIRAAPVGTFDSALRSRRRETVISLTAPLHPC